MMLEEEKYNEFKEEATKTGKIFLHKLTGKYNKGPVAFMVINGPQVRLGRDKRFLSKSGVTIRKVANPELQDYGLGAITLFLQGWDDEKDKEVLTCSQETWVHLEAAVEEFNNQVVKVSFDPHTRDIMVTNLMKAMEKVRLGANNLLAKMEKAEDVDSLMVFKRQLMSLYLNAIPLGSNECYFCLINNETCVDCAYGKEYGFCRNVGSTYDKVYNARNELAQLIETYYVPDVPDVPE